MSLLSLLHCTALLANALTTVPPRSITPYRGPNVSLVRLARNVYATAFADVTDAAMNSNSLIVVNDDDVLVVDTQDTPAAADAVIREIRKLTAKPVRFVVTTHYHGDHHFGNQRYQAAYPGVQFVGHPNTRDDALNLEAPALRAWADTGLPAEIARLRQSLTTSANSAPLAPKARLQIEQELARNQWWVAQLRQVRIVPPTITVSDSLVLYRTDHSQARSIVVRYIGRGNTRGDLVVYLPQERILATGDLIVSPMPYANGSFVSEWIGVLDTLRTWPLSAIVPGHGAVERDTTYLMRLQRLLVETRRQVSTAVANGLDARATLAAIQLDSARALFTGGNKNWNPVFDANYTSQAVERLYLEATGDPSYNAAHAARDSMSAAKFEAVNGRLRSVVYRGRPALQLAPLEGHEHDVDQEMFAVLTGSDFHDGVIEFDVSGARREGYSKAEDVSGFKGIVGITFRLHGDSAERVYIRPENSRLNNQLFRNRSTQYESMPDYPWQKLREAQPGVYESYADIEAGAWTHIKVEVSGRNARLYVNGAAQPSLVVTDLKNGDSHGAIALWSRISSDAYFANLSVNGVLR